MRIKKIHAENFLTFRELDIDFDEGLNFIVGPNGSGKTNLIRLIEYVVRSANNSTGFEEPGLYHSGAGNGFSAELFLRLDYPEKLLISDFLWLSAVEGMNVPKPSDKVLLAALGRGLRLFRPEALGDYLEVIVKWNRPRNETHVFFVAELGGQKVTIERDAIVVNAEAQAPSIYFSQLIMQYLSYNGFQEEADLNEVIEYYEKASNALAARINVSHGSINPFIFDDNLLSRVKELKKSKAEAEDDDVNKAWIRIDDFIKRCFPHGGIIDIFSFVSRLLADSVVVLRSPRSPVEKYLPLAALQRGQQSMEEPCTRPREFDGRRAVEELLKLYNSSNDNEHEMYNAIVKDFKELTSSGEGEGYEVRFVFDQSNANLSFFRSGRRYTPEFLASGELEALVLLTMLIGSENKVLLLDEPALNLHPAMQRRVLAEIRRILKDYKTPQSQAIVITHSPALIDPFEPGRIYRFYLESGATALQLINLSDNSSYDLIKRIIRQPQVLDALFSHVAILAEGSGEQFVLSELLRQDKRLKCCELAIINVDGFGEFDYYIRALEGLGIKQYVLYCDNDTYSNHLRDELKEKLEREKKLVHINEDDLTFIFCNNFKEETEAVIDKCEAAKNPAVIGQILDKIEVMGEERWSNLLKHLKIDELIDSILKVAKCGCHEVS